MSLYNTSIPSFKAMVRLSHFTKRDEDQEKFEEIENLEDVDFDDSIFDA